MALREDDAVQKKLTILMCITSGIGVVGMPAATLSSFRATWSGATSAADRWSVIAAHFSCDLLPAMILTGVWANRTFALP